MIMAAWTPVFAYDSVEIQLFSDSSCSQMVSRYPFSVAKNTCQSTFDSIKVQQTCILTYDLSCLVINVEVVAGPKINIQYLSRQFQAIDNFGALNNLDSCPAYTTQPYVAIASTTLNPDGDGDTCQYLAGEATSFGQPSPLNCQPDLGTFFPTQQCSLSQSYSNMGYWRVQALPAVAPPPPPPPPAPAPSPPAPAPSPPAPAPSPPAPAPSPPAPAPSPPAPAPLPPISPPSSRNSAHARLAPKSFFDGWAFLVMLLSFLLIVHP
eukprot:CAMPEP_0172174308 /NCGR_PEP_ID=MMETSP1050-20130122/13582_1 /TAXON_ID=233186 /ORGANISM="Cryptomonas curvata, Strain CCAP979/52" /LENGTH=264 /DNA_ID=CAMNT_0012846249 /DNA_START=327 /DNA_END=1121 /DNA_ORIENTATION=-